MSTKNIDKILVLDYGSQYNQLISRKVRELGVYSQLVSNKITVDEIKKMNNVKGLILSGGPNCANQDDAPSFNLSLLELNIPILGICYGMQIIHKVLNGTVIESKNQEYGKTNLKVKKSILFEGLSQNELVWMSHGDQVEQLAPDFKTIASTSVCNNAASENIELKIFTVQFHPEVEHTINGMKILANFVFKICGCRKDWELKNLIENKVRDIKDKVQDEKVLLAISGGVDSSVTAALLNQAIGKNLYCLFVDHGLLRKNEAEEVMEMLVKKLGINVKKIDAQELFLNKLKNIDNPEQKRKIIGQTFIEVFDKETKKMELEHQIKWLAQGTLYTDIIESGTNTANVIKSHHNVGGLPDNMKLKVIEPLNDLFKDEVRKLGRMLNLDKELINRQPFPGPGLAIRIIGEITSDKLRMVRESDFILKQVIRDNNLEGKIWQYFTCLPGIKTVGVMGDQRTYENVIVIRAVSSSDGMTADWYKIPFDVIDQISSRIVNEVKGISRVVYDVTSKPPATIEWE